MTESCPQISIACNPPLPPYADESPFGIEIHKDCWKLLERRVKDGGGYHNNNSHNSSFKGGYSIDATTCTETRTRSSVNRSSQAQRDYYYYYTIFAVSAELA